MNVAETASTFSELLVVDGAIRPRTSLARLILDDKIGRSVAFFMDIHSRFCSKRAYEAGRGMVTQWPNELMTQAQGMLS